MNIKRYGINNNSISFNGSTKESSCTTLDMNKNVGKYFFIIKNGISIYTRLTPSSLTATAVLFTESRWNMMKTREKYYLQCIAREHKKVVVAASTFDGWDTNLPWRILACSLCIKLMMAIVGIFFFKKNYIKKFSDHLKFKFPRLYSRNYYVKWSHNKFTFQKIPMKICTQFSSTQLVAFYGVWENTKKISRKYLHKNCHHRRVVSSEFGIRHSAQDKIEKSSHNIQPPHPQFYLMHDRMMNPIRLFISIDSSMPEAKLVLLNRDMKKIGVKTFAKLKNLWKFWKDYKMFSSLDHQPRRDCKKKVLQTQTKFE